MGNIGDTKGDDWEAMAKIYKQLTVGVSHRPIAVILEKVNALQPFSEATSIHDNGCGPGAIISRIIQDYPIPSSASLTASDFSSHMIDQLKQTKEEEMKADPKGPWSRLELSVQDAMDLKSISDESQSHVTAGWVYFMTADPMKCLTESHRILKPNGVLGLSSWKDSQWMAVSNNGVTAVRPDAKTIEIPEEWKSAEGIAEELKKAKFRDIDSVEVHVDMTFDSHDALVELLSEKMPHIANMTKDWSEDEKKQLKQTFREMIKEASPSEPGRMTGTALVAVGRK
ncbi:Methyltransferase tpcH [Pseudocercospora fuligena]|uniref:Methyltransferase tpcH n=1 Tax=Pseudocercospora fuligena TaxID=685502 RepID=A0A8H6RFL6_9PEZI|nr:Methyltransferase tpcH [Pseudocercospora fuligena]